MDRLTLRDLDEIAAWRRKAAASDAGGAPVDEDDFIAEQLKGLREYEEQHGGG